MGCAWGRLEVMARHGAPFRTRCFLRLLGEGGTDGGRHHLALLRADVGQRVAHEVHAGVVEEVDRG
jgi:hypothetical protein